MASAFTVPGALSSMVIVGLFAAFTPPSRADVVPIDLADLKDPFEARSARPVDAPVIRRAPLDLIDPFAPRTRVDVERNQTTRAPAWPLPADLRDPFAG